MLQIIIRKARTMREGKRQASPRTELERRERVWTCGSTNDQAPEEALGKEELSSIRTLRRRETNKKLRERGKK